MEKGKDDARDQEDFWDNKNRTNAALLDAMNQAIKDELGADPLEEAKDEKAQKKSLRNQFNFQERSS